VNSSDWVQMTGLPVVGRGGRPINPRLLTAAMGKAVPPARRSESAAAAKRRRKQQLWLAKLMTPDDLAPSRARTRALSEYEYWNATPSERAASDRVKQYYRSRLG
jgi:hypothetical protein